MNLGKLVTKTIPSLLNEYGIVEPQKEMLNAFSFHIPFFFTGENDRNILQWYCASQSKTVVLKIQEKSCCFFPLCFSKKRAVRQK